MDQILVLAGTVDDTLCVVGFAGPTLRSIGARILINPWCSLNRQPIYNQYVKIKIGLIRKNLRFYHFWSALLN